jgi:hypothetical protein
MQKIHTYKQRSNIKIRNSPYGFRAIATVAVLLFSGCNQKSTTTITNTSKRLKIIGYSHLPPQETGWSVTKKKSTILMLLKKPIHTKKGKLTFTLISRILRRGRYSMVLKKLKEQLRDDYEALEKREQFSNLKMKSSLVKFGGADCVISRISMTNTGVPGAEGNLFTLYVDQVVCNHPYNPKLITFIAYRKLEPPGILPEETLEGTWHVFNTIAISMRFNNHTVLPVVKPPRFEDPKPKCGFWMYFLAFLLGGARFSCF